jgi:hypothetical protein
VEGDVRSVITFFTIPKPFEGHIGTIQRNAIESWLHVAPDVQVLLLGEGADVAGVEHVAEIARNEHGTPLLDATFRTAAEHARHRELCFVNADILLAEAALTVRKRWDAFLVVGECWDASIDASVDFDVADWDALRRDSRKRGADSIDYFLFSSGMYQDVPPFAIGRPVFDNWLIWRARMTGARVVDATWVVKPVHQHHTYADLGGHLHIRTGPEGSENRRLLGGGRERLYSRLDATDRLTHWGLVPNPLAMGRVGETTRRAFAKLAYTTGLRKPQE